MPICYFGLVSSIFEVAKRAEVSVSTAKRAIREPHKLRPKTLQKVLSAMEELQYEPNHAAGTLRRGRDLSIGLMVGDILEPMFGMLTRTIGEVVRARDYSLLMAENMYDPQIELANLKMFNGHRISGLIIRSAYGADNYAYLKRMEGRGTVVVEIDYVHQGSPFNQIMLDNYGAVREGLTYLHSLGHRRIAPVGVMSTPEHHEERSQSFVQVMQTLGLPLPDELLPRAFRRHHGFTADLAHRLTKQLMTLPDPPTALFTLTGTCAVGALRALQELGLRLPEDVSLLTFDNYRWTSIVTPPLDVLEQPAEEMGRAAARLVLDGIESGSRVVTQQRFPAKLIRRGSCRPPASL